MKQENNLFKKNEYDANNQMVKVCGFVGFLLIVIWLCYLFNVFPVGDPKKLTSILIALPIDVIFMFSGFILKKTKFIHHELFKYYIIFSFLFIMSVLNVIIPKHAVLGWAAVIILTNHYYNPKMGIVIFIAVLISMLICIYGGMLLGEYDYNLMGPGIIKFDEFNNPYIYQGQTLVERIEQVLAFKEQTGKNLFVNAFTYYYLGRAFFLTVVFEISRRLEKRTFNLLNEQMDITSEKQKLETELQIASEIQLSVLPNVFKATSDVEILAGLRAAKEVGGDLYDYYLLDDEHVAFVVGDVSGKGTPAAMFMMKTITCLKNCVSLNKTPKTILEEVNRAIYSDDNNGMFVTCFLGILNTKTGLLQYANAGHNAPIIGQINHFDYLKCKSGFVLGAFPEAIVYSDEITLNKKDVVILYTDGITEARNIDKEFYGEKRLLDFINSRNYSSLIELQYDLRNEILDYMEGCSQADDITYLFVNYKGDQVEYTEEELVYTKDNAEVFAGKIQQCLDKYNIVDNDLIPEFLELYQGMLEKVYPSRQGDLYYRFQYHKESKKYELFLINKGISYNPLSLLTKTKHQLYYSRIGHKNIVVIK